MDDLISRRAAIDALCEEPEVWSGKDEYGQGLNNQWHYDVNALKAVPSAQRWIPCSERLPNVNGDYLVTFKYLIFYPVEVCEFKDGKWDSGMYDVVAWMFVPEAYREDGDNNE